MELLITFILGLTVGVVGIKLLKPSPKATATAPPPTPTEAPTQKPRNPEEEPKQEGKRKKVSVRTSEENYRAITVAKLPSKQILNREEKIVFKALTEFLSRWNSNEENPEEARGLLALAQVSLGEFIGPKGPQKGWTSDERTAWFALQARRVDFLIVDREFMPVLVVEHQGSGHFQGNWKQRDQDKATAYTYAKIPVVQTYATDEGNKVNHLEQPHRIGGEIAGKLNRRYGVAPTRGRSASNNTPS